MIRHWLGLLMGLSLLTACGASAPAGPEISVQDAWARPALVGPMNPTPEMPGMTATPGSAISGTPGTEMAGMPNMAVNGTNSAAYFTILNRGSEADMLVGADTDVAIQAELHETQIVNNVAEMVPIASLDIPAGGTVKFKPGGYHVMLIGLRHDLKVGDTISLTLQFQKSGAITLNVPIKSGN